MQAFIQIDHFGKSRFARKMERKQHAVVDLAYILNSSYKSSLLSSFQKLRLTSYQLDFTRKRVKRTLIRCLNKQVESAFEIWKLNNSKAQIIYEINSSSDIAVEALRTSRRVKILKKFLLKNGHSPSEINSHLESKKSRQLSLMKSFIIRCYFKISEFNVVPKAFNQLKAYTATRKAFKETFRVMHAYR